MKTLDNEVPKYIKKKESSVSKSKVKSKHKHEYVDCLLVENNRYPHKATYCKICGKIGDLSFFETEKREDGLYRMLDHDEIFEKYKDLERIQIENIWQKYVVFDKESDEVEE